MKDFKALVLITQQRVQDIRMGELYDILPNATEIELKLFKKAINNKEKKSMKDVNDILGNLLMMMIYRIIEKEVENEL